ncbi:MULTISPECIES: DUF6704 family protein [Cryobacterium]|jgi:membrane protein YdbS with pleckstrin-like domain|uniref:Uncharacterized protein n=1 Tax=Cryobacterium arcticum TaxID=670052 RepID=A0A1B1BJS3_9MICO|nr:MULTISPECIES: DUF6704 family protein [Cryobacterium]ANP72784.1 hypothetical protein PA27867_1831 [Cryobacterium arcticum]
MSFESADPGHGHSTAAWTAVTIMLIAFSIGTVAFFFEVAWLVWASAALLLLGLVAGWVMAKAGYGAASVDGSH